MLTGAERRKYERFNKVINMRLYSNIVRGGYTLDASNISKGGAFLNTTHLPKLGEIVTYEILDKSFRALYSGNAKVVRLQTKGAPSERGFAILFYKEIDDLVFKKIESN